MYVFKPQTNLCEPVENLVLAEIATSLLLDQLRKIAPICKVHHNAKMAFFSFVNFAESDNIRMV